MTGAQLWVSAAVTAPTPQSGELIGLVIADKSSNRMLVDHAVFKPVKTVSDLDPDLAPLISLEDAQHRLPFAPYYKGKVEEILSEAERLDGPHVERDLLFLEAQGVHVNDHLKQSIGKHRENSHHDACLTA